MLVVPQFLIRQLRAVVRKRSARLLKWYKPSFNNHKWTQIFHNRVIRWMISAGTIHGNRLSILGTVIRFQWRNRVPHFHFLYLLHNFNFESRTIIRYLQHQIFRIRISMKCPSHLIFVEFWIRYFVLTKLYIIALKLVFWFVPLNSEMIHECYWLSSTILKRLWLQLFTGVCFLHRSLKMQLSSEMSRFKLMFYPIVTGKIIEY